MKKSVETLAQLEFFASFDTEQGKSEESVGGKAGRQATMSEMFDNPEIIPSDQKFAKKVFTSLGYNPIPYGTTFTNTAYEDFKKSFSAEIAPLTQALERSPNPDHGLQVQSKARTIVESKPFSIELQEAFTEAIKDYKSHINEGDFTYCRSSAPSEDGFVASGSGKYDSIPCASTVEDIMNTTRQCVASRFNSTAMLYQIDMKKREKEFDRPLLDLPFAVLIQRLINSDAAGTGMTVDTQSGNPDFIVLNLSYGLGESVVANHVNADKFVISKKRLLEGKYPIVNKTIGSKHQIRRYKTGAPENIEVSDTPKERKLLQCVPDHVAIQTAKMILAWSQLVGYEADCEVAITNKTNEGWRIYFTQIRPITALQVDKKVMITYSVPEEVKSEALVLLQSGEKVGVSKVLPAKIVELQFHDMDEKKLEIHFPRLFKQALDKSGVHYTCDEYGNLISVDEAIAFITEITYPFMEPYLKLCAVILTKYGGQDGHTPIFCRENYIPGGVAIESLFERLKSGQIVTVDTTTATPVVYEDVITFDVTKTKLENLPISPIPLGLILGDVSSALYEAHIRNFAENNAGQDVELMRMEFAMKALDIHPLALVHFHDLEQICHEVCQNKPDDLKVGLEQIAEVKSRITDLSIEYASPLDWGIDRLAYAMATYASAFHRGKVTVRTSDFKSTEYRGLKLGFLFEPYESDAMLGYRGCERYTSGNYPAAFRSLECAAYNKVYNEWGYTNIVFEFPFVREEAELLKAKEIFAQGGLVEGKNGLLIAMMTEIPDNFIRARQYFPHVDMQKIGGNDAIQLTKGKGRDKGGKNPDDNEALKALITLYTPQRNDYFKETGKYVPIGFCGNQPSTDPEFARWLYENGIDSIGVMADALISTLYAITNTPMNGSVSIVRHYSNGTIKELVA